jgi:hypothetical protein
LARGAFTWRLDDGISTFTFENQQLDRLGPPLLPGRFGQECLPATCLQAAW